MEKWLRSVKVKVTSKGDRGSIKLEDVESGELFAECPLPRDVPVSTVVEPVIDSSRYFVLRVEDEASRRHAFIGLGFRERDAASDFKIASTNTSGKRGWRKPPPPGRSTSEARGEGRGERGEGEAAR